MLIWKKSFCCTQIILYFRSKQINLCLILEQTIQQPCSLVSHISHIIQWNHPLGHLYLKDISIKGTQTLVPTENMVILHILPLYLLGSSIEATPLFMGDICPGPKSESTVPWMVFHSENFFSTGSDELVKEIIPASSPCEVQRFNFIIGSNFNHTLLFILKNEGK